MKKRVNGKIVDIQGYLDLFLLAGEGVALNRRASSLVRNTIEEKSELVRDIVNEYNDILLSLVYPLNMIEEEIKYMTIAIALHDRLQQKYGELQMQVARHIKIEVEPDRILKLLAGTWAIEETDKSYTPTELELDSYSSAVGYKEYKWALSKLVKHQSTKDFYKEVMGSFLAACKGESFVLNWELEHILDFGYIPQRVEIPENKIEDIDTGMEYYLDIYSAGQRETSDTVLKIVSSKSGGVSSSVEKKRIKVYNFEVYGKNLSDSRNNNRTEKQPKAQEKGFSSVFEVLLAEGIEEDRVTQIKYRGIISQNQIIFEVNNELYIAPFDIYERPKRLVSNVTLYGFESGRIYMMKSERLSSGITKEGIYSYEVSQKKARICKIQFNSN